jgi:hypothetical protein
LPLLQPKLLRPERLVAGFAMRRTGRQQRDPLRPLRVRAGVAPAQQMLLLGSPNPARATQTDADNRAMRTARVVK